MESKDEKEMTAATSRSTFGGQHLESKDEKKMTAATSRSKLVDNTWIIRTRKR